MQNIYPVLKRTKQKLSFVSETNRPDQTKPDQTKPDQTKPDQTKPDQTRPNQKILKI